jgi:hypothetical protein
MKRRRAKLRLVGRDPADIFNDMDKLRADLGAPLRRERTTETFARIPHDRAFDLRKISGTAWLVLIELDRLLLKARGQNPVLLWSKELRAAGVTNQTRARALRQLQAAGVINIETRGRGLSPWVTHLWYQRQG